MRTPTGDVELPELAGRYYAVGAGLAIPMIPLRATLDAPDDVRGVQLEFGLRGGRLVCTRIETPPGHPGLTTTTLRRIEGAIGGLARDLFERHAVRLAERDGEVVGEPVWQRPDGSFGDDADVADEARRNSDRRGRAPLPAEHLRVVARLYREARLLGVAPVSHLGPHFPHVAPATLRNWVRKARQRGMLEPV